MFLWRKSAQTRWVEAHEELLQSHAHGGLVIVHRPERKRSQVEIVCRSKSSSMTLVAAFGGRVDQLPRNWLRQFTRAPKSTPLNIGKRLVIQRSRGFRASGTPGKARLVIPASLAFGTGEHATTAMSLRFLEELTRGWKSGWSLVDLGTGTGIIALAAKCFGAGHVVGIDHDPTAILTAKSNARLNRIRGVSFQLTDVREWKLPPKTHVITANLYSGLLIEMLPGLKGGGWLVVSGMLRSQQDEFLHALQQHDFEIVSLKCRGKWIAVLARNRSPVACAVLSAFRQRQPFR